MGVIAGTSLGAALLLSPDQAEAFQEAPTPTGVFITVTYTDPMNVRNGPGTFYDIIGLLCPGTRRVRLGIHLLCQRVRRRTANR
jgi:uncharacterized protein YgiM (DUF1202 family)